MGEVLKKRKFDIFALPKKHKGSAGWTTRHNERGPVNIQRTKIKPDRTKRQYLFLKPDEPNVWRAGG